MAQYRAPYERSPFTPPVVLLPMDKPRGVAILLVIYHQWQKLTTLFIGGISPGVTDDWKKFSRLVVFEFAEYADADSVLRALRVLGGEVSGDDKKVNIKADENIRKYLAQYEASRPGSMIQTRERERQREDGERANRRAKAEKERERSHGRENRERANNADKLKEKLKRKWLLNRERRWQHREETMATIVDVLDLVGGQFRARELTIDEADRLREQQEIELEQHRLQTLEEERKQREEAMEAELNNKKEILTLATNGVSQNNSVKPKLTLNLTSKRRAALMALAEDEEFDDEEGIKSKRKRRILWRLYQRIKENILSKKLQPFVSKRIVEYLGVQEYELVSFGIDHLRNKKSAEDLTKGMMMTLDEESELFVKKEIMAYVNF
ncbi:uncharacterized protein OCT59_008624 [Rhizophagus irregularis]|uniref:uncharacterized protein n=1 Tax=Rhizophagus irregularis TaxID=588596 RepID=UPI003330CFD9|nr:hypothetical protein OCT59_008624 [Rhizophagus irregularis]